MNQSILKKVLIAGTTLLLVAGGARANHEPPQEGCHFVMVKTPANTQSMYVVGVWRCSPWIASTETKCYRYLDWAPGWHYIGFMALNGTRLHVITLTSPDCTTGYNTTQELTVPPDDGLRIVWVDGDPIRV